MLNALPQYLFFRILIIIQFVHLLKITNEINFLNLSSNYINEFKLIKFNRNQ